LPENSARQSTKCKSDMIKRCFDICLSLVGLIILCPFFLAIAILIKLDSRGPVFFRHIRIGKSSRPFQMLKFRTMMETKHWTGPTLAPKNDPRVTTFGSILRRFKINELPQLINVLKGDMSFVGPRPEVAEFVGLYGIEAKKILSVRPGIVGPSQIRMRNEEELYPQGIDPKKYYTKYILPKKLKIDLDYVNSQSFLRDLKYLVQGIMITITGAISRRHLFENAQQIAVFSCDTFICAFSYFLAFFLRMEGEFPPAIRVILLNTLPYVVTVRMFTFMYFGLYSSLIPYMSFDEVIKIVKAATFSSVLIILLTFLVGERGHPRSVFAIDWFVLISLLGGYRLIVKTLKGNLNRNNNGPQKNILIYGAEGMGDIALRYLRMEGGRHVVAFIDDDPRKMRKRFQGVKILGNRYDIESLVRLYHIEQVLIAMRDMPFEDLEHVKSLCEKADVPYEIFALAN
jgi:lipopolysaccharide/colanic/teichoic acid biosynthesis glycosyltransferase